MMKPFDLEAAKRGDPIVCRDGTPAKFIAYVPDAIEDIQILYLRNKYVCGSHINGLVNRNTAENTHDLFMAPNKRTVWVNIYKAGSCFWHDSKDEANLAPHTHDRIGGKAYPVEIEE